MTKASQICDGHGTPLAVLTTGANLADISKAIDLLDAVPAVAGRPGRPRRRFPVLLADKGYDSQAFREECHRRRTEAIIPRRGGKNIKGLGGCVTSSSRPSACCTGSAAWPSAGNAASISTKASSASPAP